MKIYHVKFEPKEDITAYELAICLVFCPNYNYFKETELPNEQIKRHYKIEYRYNEK